MANSSGNSEFRLESNVAYVEEEVAVETAAGHILDNGILSDTPLAGNVVSDTLAGGFENNDSIPETGVDFDLLSAGPNDHAMQDIGEGVDYSNPSELEALMDQVGAGDPMTMSEQASQHAMQPHYDSMELVDYFDAQVLAEFSDTQAIMQILAGLPT